MNWKAVILSGALLLGTAGVSFAAQTTSNKANTNTTTSAKSTSSSATHHEMGTINSVTDSQLVLSHEVNKKPENTTFALDSSTKKVGSLDKGAHVEVYYKMENNQNVATEVKVEQAKP